MVCDGRERDDGGMVQLVSIFCDIRSDFFFSFHVVFDVDSVPMSSVDQLNPPNYNLWSQNYLLVLLFINPLLSLFLLH